MSVPPVTHYGFFAAAVALLGVVLYLVADRLTFLARSTRAVGAVTAVHAVDDRCGGARDRYDCTKFAATVAYAVRGETLTVDLDAGDAQGHGRPVSQAKQRVGEFVELRHDARDPRRAHRNQFWDLWRMPIMIAMLQIAASIGSFVGGRR